MSLSDKLLRIAKDNKYSSILSKSDISSDVLCTIGVPAINIALSGDINGGLHSGVLQIVGDSRCFKTCYGLILMGAYLEQNPDAMALFFDSEHGASFEYFDSFGIDKERVVHLPITDVEDLKIQCAQYLKEIERGEKVFFFIDSLGMLPSKKESEDAEDGKTVADMTRARAMNSFWRVITNPLNLKELPLIAINHYYDTMALYPEKIIKGGKGGFLASNDIWLVTRSKVKEGKELAGWNFNIKIMKSRKVKEDAKIPVTVLYDGGIDKTSGLLEIALVTGHVTSPKKGWYNRPGIDGETNCRRSSMDEDFWKPILEDGSFHKAIREMYLLSEGCGNLLNSKLDELIEE